MPREKQGFLTDLSFYHSSLGIVFYLFGMSVVGDCLVPVMCELRRIPARLKLFGSDRVLSGI